MLYDSIERAIEVAEANWETDMAAVALAKGESGIDATITVHDRLAAEDFIDRKGALPGLGIYGANTAFQAPMPGGTLGAAIVDSENAIVFDYVARGPDARALEVQCELAIEVVALLVRRIREPNARGVWNAGGARRSIRAILARTAQQKGSRNYEERMIATVPVIDRNTLT